MCTHMVSITQFTLIHVIQVATQTEVLGADAVIITI